MFKMIKKEIEKKKKGKRRKSKTIMKGQDILKIFDI